VSPFFFLYFLFISHEMLFIGRVVFRIITEEQSLVSSTLLFYLVVVAFGGKASDILKI